VQEDGPTVPGEIQGTLEFIPVMQDAEATLCVRVSEGIGSRVGWSGIGYGWLLAHGQAQQGLLRFLRQMRERL
jgi:hypothetical protein